MSKDSSCFENFKTKKLNEIMESLKEKEDDELRLSYKQVCAKLKYLSKIHYFLLDTTVDFVGLFKEWHAIIIDFLEFRLKQQSITRFPLFGFMAKKYKAIFAMALNQKSGEKKTQQKNAQKSPKKSFQRTFPAIFYQQQCIINQQKTNRYLESILLDKIMPQNTECICCSRVLIRNFSIVNLNPQFTTISAIPKFEQADQMAKTGKLQKFTELNKDMVNQLFFENVFNAVNNNGGGVVIIGAEKKQSSTKVIGISFKNREQVCSKIQMLKGCLDSIKPGCSFRIDAVLVINEDQFKINLQECEQRYCFRILIKPYRNNRISYLQRKKKETEITNSRQFYFFTRAQIAEKLLNNSSLYKKIHALQKKQRKRQNSHKNILCYEPLMSLDKQNSFQCGSNGIFHKKKTVESGESSLEELKEKEELLQQQWEKDLQIKNIVDLPSFKFQKQSLLIVGSQNQDKYVNSFISFIKGMEMEFEVKHLFPETFKGCARSVWLISHDVSHAEIKDSLKQFSEKQLSKKQPITTMPVHTILQILLTKLTPFIEQALKTKMSQHFSITSSGILNQNPENNSCSSGVEATQYYLKCKSQYYDHKHKENKKIYYLKFTDKIKSLFAYMCFQMQQLRPYFVSQKDCKVKF